MEKKNQNLLLLALAGFGIYYFLKKKNESAPVVPPTTGELPQPPVEQIKTPVEPIYQAPIYDQRDPIYQEPIYNAPRVETPVVSTPERGKIDVPPPAIVQAPIYDYVQPPATIWDQPIIDNPYPNERIKTPVEPIYQEPIYQPIYQEPIYQPAPVYTQPEPVYSQPEPTPYYESNVEYGGSVTDFVNNIPFLGMLYERDAPIEYDFEQKRR